MSRLDILAPDIASPAGTRMSRLVLATRGSKLALRQAEIVASLITSAHPGVTIDVRVVKTTGDKDSRPFAQIGGKGLFTSEVEREVAEGRADLAVHSAKDLTAAVAPGCVIAAVPVRERVEDVIVGGTGSAQERLSNIAPGARIGTSSIRRRALLAETRPDVDAVEFRGNLDTRLRKIAGGVVDGALLAAAGIARLGMWEAADPAPLEPTWWVPPPGQGALAIETREDRTEVIELLSVLDDPEARATLEAERAFSERLEGDCSVPLGCFAQVAGERLVVTGYLGHPSGTNSIRDRISGGLSHARDIGVELAEAIIAGGGDDILEELEGSDTRAPGSGP